MNVVILPHYLLHPEYGNALALELLILAVFGLLSIPFFVVLIPST